MNNNSISLIIVFTLLVVIAPGIILASNSVSIKNSISVTANTGGNNGESVSAGDASARSSVKTNILSDGDNNAEVEVKAEANGEKAEVKINSMGNESVNITKESTGGQNKAVVDVEINIEEDQIVCDNEKSEEDTEVCIADTVETENSENKSIILKIGKNIKSVVGNIVNKLISIFS